MDEPLSNLDAKLRVQMRTEVSRIQQRLGTTTVYVTHDQTEAMTLGNRVAVLRDGVLQQFDPPQRLYHHPVNLFVGTFIGSPTMNLVRAQLVGGTVRFADHILPLPPGSPLRDAAREAILGIRPHDFALAGAPREAPATPPIRVVAEVVERLGPASNVIFRIDAPPVHSDATGSPEDEDEGKLLADERGSSFTAAISGYDDVREGEPLDLVVDAERLYFFDPDTGAALDAHAVPAATS
jgi:multiple sugar transport system ATP-binding protein